MTYTSKVPTTPGFYVVRFDVDGETKYALADWRSSKINGKEWECSPTLFDLEQPHVYWTMPKDCVMEFGPRIQP